MLYPGRGPGIVRLEKAAQRAAADWEKQARAEYEKDLYDPERVKAREVDRTKTDFTRFVLEEWFPICIDNGERKPKTVSFYHDTTKNIVSHFQGQIVQKISAPAIQKFLIYLRTEKGFAPQNVHHHYRTLNMIFAYAMRQEIIAKNPMDKVDRPKLARKKVDALTQDEAKAFFAALGEQPLDIYPGGLALALLLPLDQTDALAGVQPGQQPHGLVPPAVQIAAYLVYSVVNVDAPSIVVPFVFDGQAHTVKQHPIEQLGVRGQVLKPGVGDKLAGDTEIGKLHRLVAVKIAW